VADSTAEREDIMQEKKFKVTYKNGVERIYKAYSMKLCDGKLYQCCKAFVGDQSVIDGSRIEKVEEVEA
jgi:hypothetical protein